MPIPAAMASSGRRSRSRLAVEDHLAGVGLDEAGQDLHQGRLAGAVLAEQAVQLALLRRSRIDAIVGPHRAEVLVDVPQLRGASGAYLPALSVVPSPAIGHSAALAPSMPSSSCSVYQIWKSVAFSPSASHAEPSW